MPDLKPIGINIPSIRQQRQVDPADRLLVNRLGPSGGVGGPLVVLPVTTVTGVDHILEISTGTTTVASVAPTGLLAIDGTGTQPSYSFSSNPTLGAFRPAADVFGITAAGAEVVRFASVNSTLTGNWLPDTHLVRSLGSSGQSWLGLHVQDVHADTLISPTIDSLDSRIDALEAAGSPDLQEAYDAGDGTVTLTASKPISVIASDGVTEALSLSDVGIQFASGGSIQDPGAGQVGIYYAGSRRWSFGSNTLSATGPGQSSIGIQSVNGYLKLSGRQDFATSDNPSVTIAQTADLPFIGADINQQLLHLNAVVEQTGTSSFTALDLKITETTLGTGEQNAIKVTAGTLGDTAVFAVRSTGQVVVPDGDEPAVSIRGMTHPTAGAYIASSGTVGFVTNVGEQLRLGSNYAYVSSHIIPTAASWDLGYSVFSWRDGYIDRVLTGDGTQALPAIAAKSDPDTGLYFTTGALRTSIGGFERFHVHSQGIRVNESPSATLPAVANLGDTTTGIGLHTGAVGAIIGNVEKLRVDSVSAHFTARAIPTADLTYDLGTAALRWRTLFSNTVDATALVSPTIDGLDTRIDALEAAGAPTLQSAYEAGSSIVVDTTQGAIAASNATDATTLLSLSRTFAGAGKAIDISMGAGTTDAGIAVHAETYQKLIELSFPSASDSVELSALGIEGAGGNTEFVVGTKSASGIGVAARDFFIRGGAGSAGDAALAGGSGAELVISAGVGGADGGAGAGADGAVVIYTGAAAPSAGPGDVRVTSAGETVVAADAVYLQATNEAVITSARPGTSGAGVAIDATAADGSISFRVASAEMMSIQAGSVLQFPSGGSIRDPGGDQIAVQYAGTDRWRFGSNTFYGVNGNANVGTQTTGQLRLEGRQDTTSATDSSVLLRQYGVVPFIGDNIAQSMVRIEATTKQTGTSSFNALEIDITEDALHTATGDQRLIDARKGGLSQFIVDDDGSTHVTAGTFAGPGLRSTSDGNTGLSWQAGDRLTLSAGSLDVLTATAPGGSTPQTLIRAGSELNPGLAAIEYPTSGLRWVDANNVRITTSGADQYQFTLSAFTPLSTRDLGSSANPWVDGHINRVLTTNGFAVSPAHSFAAATGDGMFYDAARGLGIAHGGAEFLRLFDGATILESSLVVQAGSLATLGISPEGDSTTGVYFTIADGGVRVASQGVERLSVAGTSIIVTGNLRRGGTGREIGLPGESWESAYIDTVFAANGLAANPSHSFANNPDSGMWTDATNLCWSVTGAQQLELSTSDLTPAGDFSIGLGDSNRRYTETWTGKTRIATSGTLPACVSTAETFLFAGISDPAVSLWSHVPETAPSVFWLEARIAVVSKKDSTGASNQVIVTRTRAWIDDGAVVTIGLPETEYDDGALGAIVTWVADSDTIRLQGLVDGSGDDMVWAGTVTYQPVILV